VCGLLVRRDISRTTWLNFTKLLVHVACGCSLGFSLSVQGPNALVLAIMIDTCSSHLCIRMSLLLRRDLFSSMDLSSSAGIENIRFIPVCIYVCKCAELYLRVLDVVVICSSTDPLLSW